MTNLEKVENYYLQKEAMTQKKLQKLIYYAYAWVLALLNEEKNELNIKLFDNRIEAWVHGPVVPEVYQKYKKYGWDNIPTDNEDLSKDLSDEVKNILSQVWDVYGKFTGNELESLTHQETPWIKARKDMPVYENSSERISDIDIFEYYNSVANENE